MNPTENLDLLKTLRRGVEQLRAEYRTASRSIRPHIEELRQQRIRGSSPKLKDLQGIQRERHQQLSELVPYMRSVQICAAQAKQRLVYGPLEQAAAPLLVSLLELALSSNPLPDSHLMWNTRIDPMLLLSANLDIIGCINRRGYGKLYSLMREKDWYFVPKLRGTTLRELRLELLHLASGGEPVVSEAHNPLESPRRVAFEALRARLINTLAPEEFVLLKEFSRFI